MLSIVGTLGAITLSQKSDGLVAFSTCTPQASVCIQQVKLSFMANGMFSEAKQG